MTGGAAIACKRLLKALQAVNVDAWMLVRDKRTDDPRVVSVNNSWMRRKMNLFRFIWERFVIWKNNDFSKRNLFAVSIANTGVDISRLKEVQEADVIHIHWVSQGFLSLSDIKKLIGLGKPVVWTMHDMWACTGICHHARECEHYRLNCGDCFFLKKPAVHDLSYRTMKKKKEAGFNRITYVACSEWLKNRTGKSSLMQDSRLLSISNPLNISLFSPQDRVKAREKYSFSPDKYYLLFGAARISDPRKGFEYYFESLELLAKEHPELRDRIELVFLGNSELQLPATIPYKANFTGYISEEDDVALLYSAVDVFVMPSLEENLPNTIMESMACGTPVVGFEIGGIPEMIDHKINGYLVTYKNSRDLMQGIFWTLFEADRMQLAKAARVKAVQCYSEEKIAGAYLDLYEELLSKK